MDPILSAFEVCMAPAFFFCLNHWLNLGIWSLRSLFMDHSVGEIDVLASARVFGGSGVDTFQGYFFALD